MRRTKAVACGVIVLGAFVAGADATITVYTNRADWEAAVGATDFLEDFEGFTVDTPFHASPVDLNGFTLVQTGFRRDFRNIVDVPPFQFSDNNGTNNASMFVNIDRSMGDTGVLLTPDAGLRAWGADFSGAGGSELVNLILTTPQGDMTFSPGFTSGGIDEFWGFIASADMAVSDIDFAARIYVNDPGGEGFTMDNVAGAYIPAPSVLALLGLAGLATRRRRA